MKDIFISYKKGDKPWAKSLVEAFKGQGWSVWWDQKIPAGKTWADVIEEAIMAAKCVVVLWSKASVESEWVKKEARYGMNQDHLFPVLIEKVEIPFEFGHLQAANLSDWDKTADHEQFGLLLNQIKAHLDSFSAASTEPGVSSKDVIRVNPSTAGPIVGATGSDSVRLWARGKLERVLEQAKWCFGVARIRAEGEESYGKPWSFKMKPAYDMTGVAVFDGLQPKRKYTYQIGWFFSELMPKDLHLKKADMDWSRASEGSFRTSDPDADSLSFVLGSGYLARLFSDDDELSRGDKTYRSILRRHGKKAAINLLLIIGDKIYADDLHLLLPDKRIDQYKTCHHKIFSQPYIRKLLSHLPVYMTLDDHQIANPQVFQVYQSYQMGHSPLFNVKKRHLIGVPLHYWYTFQNGCCDFFVMDIRTERRLAEYEAMRQMICSEQMDAFLEWLKDGSGRVKCVVTSLPFFPDYREPDDDTWSGFLRQRTQILDFIRDKKIPRIVFLSGGVRCSMSAELISPSQPKFKVISVISSSFFWPYPHRRRAFMFEGALVTSEPRDYIVTNPSDLNVDDSFTHVTASLKSLKVEVFDRKNKALYKEPKKHTY